MNNQWVSDRKQELEKKTMDTFKMNQEAWSDPCDSLTSVQESSHVRDESE